MSEEWVNIWPWLQQTLYTKSVSESVFHLSFVLWFLLLCFCFFLLCKDTCLMFIFLVSCYGLVEARPGVWRPFVSHLGSPAAPRLADRSSASVSRWRCSRREGAALGGVCHRETSRSVGVRRPSAGLSAPLKSEHGCHGPASLRIRAQRRDWGEAMGWVVPCVACCFCPALACWGDADLDCVNVEMTFPVMMLLV